MEWLKDATMVVKQDANSIECQISFDGGHITFDYDRRSYDGWGGASFHIAKDSGASYYGPMGSEFMFNLFDMFKDEMKNNDANPEAP